MAKSDETEMAQKAQTEEGATAPQEDILDAELVEEPEGEAAEADDPLEEASATEDDESPVEIEEPTDVADEISEESEDEGDEAELEVTSEDTPAEEPEIAVAPSAPVVEVKKVGFMPVVLGGVVAAAIGFGGATYLSTQGILFGAPDDGAALAALDSRIAQQQSLIEALQAEQSEISGVAAAAQAAGDSAQAIVARVDALSARIETLDARLIESEKRPMTDGLSASAVAAYEREVEDLRAMVSAQLAEAQDLKETTQKTALETLGRAALTRVVSALESGAAYRVALTELSSVTGVSAPAALDALADAGAPTLASLAGEFPDYARVALADARKQQSGAEGSRLGSFFKSQLGARSVEPKAGDDPDSVLSRAEAAVKEGRVADAIGELQSLPDTSQALMQGWTDRAQARVDALRAAETLAQSLTE